jgi:hypothetical protein
MKAWWGPWLGVMLLAGCQPSAGLAEVKREGSRPSADAPQAAGPGECLKEGEGASAYGQRQTAPEGAPEQACCPGLTRLEAYEPSSVPKQCLVSKGGRYVCTRCGDGQCREGENTCNCPKDCP